MALLTPQAWEQFIDDHPQAHILQTPAWGELKAAFGWSPFFLHRWQIGAMILFRRLPFGSSIGYIPRGPVGEGCWGDFWPEVDALCCKEGALFLRVEPDIWQPVDLEFTKQQLPGFTATNQTIQPPRTIWVDLRPSEDEILMAMKSKTRYNIRLAERKGVIVQASSDVKTFYQMSLTTSQREDFGIHTLAYYQRAFDLFAPRGVCTLLIATYQDQPIAGLMAFAHGDTAWYFYGASTDQERQRMPTYLLQWEAMRWAKSKGCKLYDLWGVPDHAETILEQQFMGRSDGLWGVYRFKRGFGGEIRRTIGAYDRVYRPFFYKLYQSWVGRHQSTGGVT